VKYSTRHATEGLEGEIRPHRMLNTLARPLADRCIKPKPGILEPASELFGHVHTSRILGAAQYGKIQHAI